MKKTIINLGSNYICKNGKSTSSENLKRFVVEHPNAVVEDIDLRSLGAKNGIVAVYDLYEYDYNIGKYVGNAYPRKVARYIEREENK